MKTSTADRPRALGWTLALFLAVAPLACGDSAPPASPGTSAQTAAQTTAPSTAMSTTAAPEAPATSGSAEPSAPPPAPTTEPRVNFNMVDADADDLLQALSHLLEKEVKIEPAAKPYLPCAMVTITAPDRITVSEALARATLSLRTHGLVLTTTDTHLVVSKAPDAPPCSKH